jgi:hypothetical protein
MKKCDKCGVLLDEGFDSCPLCTHDESMANKPSQPGEVLRASRKETVRYMWELSGVVCITGIVIILLLNLLFTGSINWSLYPVTSISWIWLTLTIIMFTNRWPFGMLLLLLANTLIMLIMFNIFSSTINWFVPVAMPVTTVLFILAGIVVWISNEAKYKGFNVLALALIAVNILCVTIEVFADLHIYHMVSIRWSAVVSAGIIPVASVLMFLHYRLRRGRRLDSFFHV